MGLFLNDSTSSLLALFALAGLGIFDEKPTLWSMFLIPGIGRLDERVMKSVFGMFLLAVAVVLVVRR